MNICDFIKKNIVFLDGGMGTMLQNAGLPADIRPERWNIDNPEAVISVHKAYYDSGSNIVSSNTFGVNSLIYTDAEMEKLIKCAYENCFVAKSNSLSNQPKYIAFNIGPTGKLLKPLGDLEFEDAVEIFAKSVRIANKYAFDLIFIETMNDSYETKAALLACKENCDLPVFVSNAYTENGRLLTGATPSVMATMLESMGASAVGANCSFGPEKTMPVIEELLENTSLPVIMKPNAGLPSFVDGKTVYNVSPVAFAEQLGKAVDKGARIVGGCCGTTPNFIKEVVKINSTKKSFTAIPNHRTVVSSSRRIVEFGKRPVLIGERINPTGKKRFKQALLENDTDYIISEGITQQEKGAHILDVNVGLAGINEPDMLERVITQLQSVCDLPLQIDSADPVALEKAMRIYNGKPLVNSVNAKKESMDAVFPLIKKYGGTVIALTLDENGIPADCDGRLELAEKILRAASEYGIKKEDIIFDPLTMSVSTDINSAETTLNCVKEITERLQCKTLLGVSNISFGLPQRELINSHFFYDAMSKGLSAAIMNPLSEKMTDTYYSYCALNGLDEGFADYITYCDKDTVCENKYDENIDLLQAIIKGRSELAVKITGNYLKNYDALYVINNFIIPALDKTGFEYQSGKLYLPQLLLCAEAAGASFEVIKENAVISSERKCKILLATVEGDIHDIGKNIVKMLLENYGFEIIDLGKDVGYTRILDEINKNDIALVGLSALMTTTLDSMKKTVSEIKNSYPDLKVVVGGAVVNEEFAASINADFYAKDAMDTVRFAEKINSNMA